MRVESVVCGLMMVAALLATPVWAQPPEVTVATAWARGTVAGQGATGAFMELTARADAALVGVSSSRAGLAGRITSIVSSTLVRITELSDGAGRPLNQPRP